VTSPGPRRDAHARLAIALTVCLGVLIGLWGPSAHAQREPGSVSLGPQVGQPGGLTLKLYRPSPIAYDVLLTFDADDFVRLAAYRLWERPLPDSLVYVYAGPGLATGGRRLDTDPSLTAGLGGKLGLNFFADRFEVFLYVAPIARVSPDFEPRLGAGVGLRYDLRQP
jgi:hypothetical protein